jgi:hypothetical protein
MSEINSQLGQPPDPWLGVCLPSVAWLQMVLCIAGAWARLVGGRGNRNGVCVWRVRRWHGMRSIGCPPLRTRTRCANRSKPSTLNTQHSTFNTQPSTLSLALWLSLSLALSLSRSLALSLPLPLSPSLPLSLSLSLPLSLSLSLPLSTARSSSCLCFACGA